MRLLFISLLFLPATVGAETLADTHFTGSFCWERAYDQDHLANHPEQQTTRFAIGREPPGHPSAPGEIPMELRVRVRGESEEFTAVGYCDPDEARFRCGLEGDAGLYMIEAQGPDNVLVTVGERPMLFEGSVRNHEFRSDEGDDRAFLLRRCS